MSHQAATPESRRQFFRFRYPIAARPELLISGIHQPVAVAELSERGLRWVLPPKHSFVPQQRIIGTVRFHDNGTELIEGTILRLHQGEAVLALTSAIPFRVIAEQRYLSHKFPGFGTSLE